MKKFIGILIIVFLCTSLCAQVPATISLRAGDSEAKGLLGMEIIVSHFSFSGGWRPGSAPIGQKINSWDFAFTYYQRQWYETGFYVSIAYATQGGAYKKSLYNESYTIEPSKLIMLGLRMNANDVCEKFSDRILIDAGLGYKGSDHSDLFTFEVGIGFSIFKVNPNHNSIRSPYRLFKRIR